MLDDFILDLIKEHSTTFISNEKLRSRGFINSIGKMLDQDLRSSSAATIVTGYSSLVTLVNIFGINDYDHIQNVQIVIGLQYDKDVASIKAEAELTHEAKERWLSQSISFEKSSAVLHLIDKIKNGRITFYLNRYEHSKIYCFDSLAYIGSANLSETGLGNSRRRGETKFRTDEKIHVEVLKAHCEKIISESSNINELIIDVLKTRAEPVGWSAALAIAINRYARKNYSDSAHDYEGFLVTHQIAALNQAMSILQNHPGVLVCLPTGSGKTKLAIALANLIYDRQNLLGFDSIKNIVIISPKKILEDWSKESSFGSILPHVISMSMLQRDQLRPQDELALRKADMILIDEIHNFINPESNRSIQLANINPKIIIGLTATPINKSLQDLFRTIEIFDVELLDDKSYDMIVQHKGNLSPGQTQQFATAIRSILVGQSKSEINEIAEANQGVYRRLGSKIGFPKISHETYDCLGSDADRDIVQKIIQESENLTGILFTRTLHEGKVIPNEMDIFMAAGLAKFHIIEALRSSKSVLIEHIVGTKAAANLLEIESIKENLSKGCANEIRKMLKKLDSHEKDTSDDFKKFRSDLAVYDTILDLCQELSNFHEHAKLNLIKETCTKSLSLIVFDRRPIALEYLLKIGADELQEYNPILAFGNVSKNKLDEIKKRFSHSASKPSVGLFSDSLKESINLPGAEVIINSDLPWALVTIVQRTGRINRINSPHPKNRVFWPVFDQSLYVRADYRSSYAAQHHDRTLRLGDEAPLNRIPSQGFESTSKYIQEFNNESTSNAEFLSNYQCISRLSNGSQRIIEESDIQKYANIASKVHNRIAAVESEEDWGFFLHHNKKRHQVGVDSRESDHPKNRQNL